MKSSKLLLVLKQLNRKERIAFRKFLHSPYFNHRRDVIDLYECLQQQLKKEQPDLRKAHIYQLLFPDQPFDDQAFYLVTSYLLKLLEQFLAVQGFLNDQPAANAYLIQDYKKKGLQKHLKYTIKQQKRQLEQYALRDSRYFEHLRNLSWQEYQLEEVKKPSGVLSLEALSKWTDVAYLSQKLRQICLFTAHQSVYQVAYENAKPFIETIFHYLKHGEWIEIPAVGIYYHGYHVLKGEEETAHFEQFKQLLFDHANHFRASEVRELYLLAINFCVKQVNKGNKSYFSEMLALYQKGLELAVLLENGIISRFTYHNAVAAALQIKAYDWAEQFIHQYQAYLAADYQESTFHFNLARLEYEQSHYDHALDLLQKANFQDVLLNLAAKTISLKIYYKLEAFDLLDAHLNAMNNFIRRNRVIGYHRKNYLNIIRYTKKLLGLNWFDRDLVQQLKGEIQGEEVLTEKEWFIQQLS